MTRRAIFLLPISRATSIPSANSAVVLRWEDGGADWLHATRRGSVNLNTLISSEARSLSSVGVAGQLARRARKN